MKKFKSILIMLMTVLLAGCNKEAASIGIIGGADGPTAIFVTSTVNKGYFTTIICLSIVLLVGIVILVKRKKR